MRRATQEQELASAIDMEYDTPTHGVQAINHQQAADVGA